MQYGQTQEARLGALRKRVLVAWQAPCASPPVRARDGRRSNVTGAATHHAVRLEHVGRNVAETRDELLDVVLGEACLVELGEPLIDVKVVAGEENLKLDLVVQVRVLPELVCTAASAERAWSRVLHSNAC